MAKLLFILQAARDENHADHLEALLKVADPQQVIFSVAFARTSGIDVLRSHMAPVIKKMRVYVGIRNDITSVQAIEALLDMGIEVYAVDTGSRATIFHPKVFVLKGKALSIAVVGSANLTFNGLYNNIEVSTRMELDPKDPADVAYLGSVFESFEKMAADHPKHVFRVIDKKHAQLLLDQGRLADETIVLAPRPGGFSKSKVPDDVPPMSLVRKKRAVPASGAVKKTSVKKPKTKKAGATKVAAPPSVPVNGPASVPVGLPYKVWESKPLVERDLNIPKGASTNPTGSMGLKKGLYEDIDHRHYFYDDVFSGLTWVETKPGSKILHAIGKFDLIIKNVNYGTFNLVVAHKTDTTSKTYLQNNFMTQLHWGDALPLVKREDLLTRQLILYRKAGSSTEFILEID